MVGTTSTTAYVALVIAGLTFIWQVLTWWFLQRTRIKVRLSTLNIIEAGKEAVPGFRINVMNRSAFTMNVSGYALAPKGTRREKVGPWRLGSPMIIQSRDDGNWHVPTEEFPSIVPERAVAWVLLPGQKRKRSWRRPTDIGTLVISATPSTR